MARCLPPASQRKEKGFMLDRLLSLFRHRVPTATPSVRLLRLETLEARALPDATALSAFLPRLNLSGPVLTEADTRLITTETQAPSAMGAGADSTASPPESADADRQ